MAWMWWLLAPVASTVLGASVIWWRAAHESGSSGRARDAMTEHQDLLRALQRPGADHPVPVTMQVLDSTP